MVTQFEISGKLMPISGDDLNTEYSLISLVPIVSEKTTPTKLFVTAESANRWSTVTEEGITMSVPAFLLFPPRFSHEQRYHSDVGSSFLGAQFREHIVCVFS